MKDRDDKWEQEWKAGYKEPGDYLAGEPPSVDTMGYMPDEAPYPTTWPPNQRVAMTHYARRHNIRVDYNPNAADEGASGWLPAWDALMRDKNYRQAQIEASRAAGANPQPQLDTTPAPPVAAVLVPDPAEPRHPRIEDW